MSVQEGTGCEKRVSWRVRVTNMTIDSEIVIYYSFISAAM
jgi:hypothetical protein